MGNYRLAFVSKDNLLQNILGKFKKPNNVRQYRRSLIYVFASFLSVTAKYFFRREDWTLGSVSKQFRDFANISLLPKILSFSLISYDFNNSYLRFLILDYKFRFICGEWNEY